MKGLFPCGASPEDSHNPAQRQAAQATGRQPVCSASTCRAFLQSHSPSRGCVDGMSTEGKQDKATRVPETKANTELAGPELQLQSPATGTASSPFGKSRRGSWGLRQLLGLEFRRRRL